MRFFVYVRRQLAFWIIVLLALGGGALALGGGTRVAVAGAPPTSSRSMAGMAMPAATRPAGARGAVVRLHRRLVRVTISNFAFSPARLVVSPGTRIVWTNRDSDPHTVTSTKGVWASDALDTDSQFARVFKKTGTFSYYCSIHPFMHGVIVVKR